MKRKCGKEHRTRQPRRGTLYLEYKKRKLDYDDDDTGIIEDLYPEYKGEKLDYDDDRTGITEKIQA